MKEKMKKITLKQIEEAKTSRRGWTKEQLIKWGVSWPPKKGWKTILTTDRLES